MKIATYNIQNIFYRDSTLLSEYSKQNMELWTEEFEQLMVNEPRTEDNYSRMRDLSVLLGFHKTPNEPYLVMRRKAGSLHIKNCDEVLDYKSMSLTNWNGWIKLSSIPVNERAIQNKARVICDCMPDILILQEIEDRASLMDFNKLILSSHQGKIFDQIVHLDGNDKKGRGMAIMVKKGFQITSIRSHANDLDEEGKLIFDNDFLEYKIKTPSGIEITVISAHLLNSSKYEKGEDLRHKKQVHKISDIYEEHLLNNSKHIAIVGTLNVPSYSSTISRLFESTDLKDIVKHKSFDVEIDKGSTSKYHRMGAYRMGVNVVQKDYLLLSPALFQSISDSGLIRKGVWAQKCPQWNMYKSILNENQAASEHPLLWAKLEI